MNDQSQNQSSEQPKVFEKMPAIDEFKTLDSETQRELIEKFGAAEDQEDEKSEPSDEDSSKKEQPITDEKDSGSEAETKDTQDASAKKEEPDLAKRYKELEAEFTRRSQKMRDLERRLDELSKVNKGQEPEVKSPLDKLVEDNPKAKDLIDALREDMEQRLEAKVKQGIRPIQETLSKQQAAENYGKFQAEVKEFLSSPLGKMEAEFNEEAAGMFENQDALLEGAAKDPALFQKLKEKVLAKHFVKAARLFSGELSPEDKNKSVKQTGVSGKSKTTTEVDDELDLKTFNKLSSDEMKKVLAKHGAVKSS